ncbi:hypothetical protein [Tuberibacillus sp. Marseille-P3662]|uniref:hypothetical protein n=1 Tax=Tuberibacillus sp. Marseille-P3662 TaxID=1965358 RepID=UPI00111C8766|nr:hypothetical protein [Tuberibacillus sp. Marseille-P3662]
MLLHLQVYSEKQYASSQSKEGYSKAFVLLHLQAYSEKQYASSQSKEAYSKAFVLFPQASTYFDDA